MAYLGAGSDRTENVRKKKSLRWARVPILKYVARGFGRAEDPELPREGIGSFKTAFPRTFPHSVPVQGLSERRANPLAIDLPVRRAGRPTLMLPSPL
jgi:hypothetical protein